MARGVSIAVFYPLLSTGKIGYPMTPRTALVMVWAGLRGAVGVAMSLFVLFDPLIESAEFKVGAKRGWREIAEGERHP